MKTLKAMLYTFSDVGAPRRQSFKACKSLEEAKAYAEEHGLLFGGVAEVEIQVEKP